MWLRRELYNLKLKISHLVANGCSYTYGHGIPNPLEDAWPSLVAKELGVPLVNLAIPGQGNDAIYRHTNRYFYKNLYYDNNPLYIHAYSQSARQEIYAHTDVQGNISQAHQLLDSSPGNKLALDKEVLLQTDEWAYHLLEEHKCHLWASINALLDSYKINHLASDYMPQTDGAVRSWMWQHNYNLQAEIYTHSNKLTDFNIVTHHIPKTSCLHETEEGHRYLADYILRQINARWDGVEVITEDYATLGDSMVVAPNASDRIRRIGIDRTKVDEVKELPSQWLHNLYYLNELGLPWLDMHWMGKPHLEAELP